MTPRPFRFRSLFLWLHRWLGLVSGVVVLVVSLTGCGYVFEEELRQWLYADYLTVPRQAGPKLPVSRVQTMVQRAYPAEKLTQIRLKNDPVNSAIIVYTASERLISVNPYTGQPFAVRERYDDWLTLIEEIHVSLLLDEFGKQVVKWNVLIFFLILLSGLWVWWPKQWRFLRHALRIKWGASVKRVNYDLHAVGGFYALLILLVVAWTGLYWTFDSAKALTYWVTGDPQPKKEKLTSHPTPAQASLSPAQLLDGVMREADRLGPYRQAFLQLPKDPTGTLRLVLRYPYRWVRRQNVLQFDQYSGKLLKADLATRYTVADKIRMSNYDLHVGRMLGLPGKILWFLASLFSASLPITGFLIWWGKRTKAPGVTRKNRPVAGGNPGPGYRPQRLQTPSV